MTHRRKTEMRPQWPNNILCEVWLVRVPDEAYGDNLRGVHKDPSDPDPLATFALENKETKKKEHSFTQKQVTKKHIEQITEKWYLNLLNNCSFTEHELIKALYIGHLLDSYEGPQSYLLLVTVPQMTRVCVEASVD